MPHPFVIPGAALTSSRIVEFSRRILGGVRGERFGEYYMMNSYHWLWPFTHVAEFATDVLMGLNVLQNDYLRSGGPFLEDTFYHYIFPRRKQLGYNFVSLLPRMEQILGRRQYNQVIHSKIYTFEIMYGNFDCALSGFDLPSIPRDTDLNAHTCHLPQTSSRPTSN